MITDPQVENYLYAVLPERAALLKQMERQAKEHDIPIVGPAVARVFYQYAKLIQARTVFEMGSAIGYSTIWWAMAVGDAGKVHYTDGSDENAEEARRYFAQAGVADLIEVHVGDAVEVLSEQKQEFDVLFCDIDKPDYPRVARQAAPHVRQGGLFIADNTLWRGLVAYGAGNPELAQGEPDRNAAAMVEFNRILYSSPEWFTTILPLRDGVTVALRT